MRGLIYVITGKSSKNIEVYMEKETPESKNIPDTLEGYRVKIEVIGAIEPR